MNLSFISKVVHIWLQLQGYQSTSTLVPQHLQNWDTVFRYRINTLNPKRWNITNLPYKSYHIELHSIHQLPSLQTQLIGQSELLILQQADPLATVLSHPEQTNPPPLYNMVMKAYKHIAYLDNDFKAVPLIRLEIVWPRSKNIFSSCIKRLCGEKKMLLLCHCKYYKPMSLVTSHVPMTLIQKKMPLAPPTSHPPALILAATNALVLLGSNSTSTPTKTLTLQSHRFKGFSPIIITQTMKCSLWSLLADQDHCTTWLVELVLPEIKAVTFWKNNSTKDLNLSQCLFMLWVRSWDYLKHTSLISKVLCFTKQRISCKKDTINHNSINTNCPPSKSSLYGEGNFSELGISLKDPFCCPVRVDSVMTVSTPIFNVNVPELDTCWDEVCNWIN